MITGNKTDIHMLIFVEDISKTCMNQHTAIYDHKQQSVPTV